MDQQLRKQLESQKWFHAIDFGEFAVPSYIYPSPNVPPNSHLFPTFRFLDEMSLQDMRCLDMGTFDGMTAFVIDRMGAGRVDATCQHDLLRFRLAREALGADRVVYHPGTQIEDLLEKFGEGSFDLVIVSVALHHLLLPLEGLFICRRLLKRNGIFLLEAIAFEGGEPAVHLSSEMADPVFGPHSAWTPTDAALIGMLRLASFEHIARTDLPVSNDRGDIHVGGGGRRVIRTTTLNVAVPPSEVSARSPRLAAIHDEKKWTGRIDYRALSDPEWPSSTIGYKGPAGVRTIDVQKFVPHTPLQPKWATATSADLARH